jgi:deoxyuridine 5'-triphosphate nucleotidohydrolase
MQVEITKLRDTAILPEYQTAGAAAFDFHADLVEPKVLQPGERFAVPTGLAMAPPDGYAVMIYARSGLAAKQGITMANGVGVIDSDYRGEYLILLINLSDQPFTIEPGMRVAQGVLTPVARADWREVRTLNQTKRGSGGFGSTGVSR